MVSIPEYVHTLINEALTYGASDVHITTFYIALDHENGFEIMRLSGILSP